MTSGTSAPQAKAQPAKDQPAPLLLVRSSGNMRVVHGADDIALARGLYPGQRLADALACVPEARVEDADPTGDLARLHALAQWATRFSPHATPDAPDGLMIDITGCAHLWKGEEQLMADALTRLSRQGFTVRAAIAGTIGAAWASARFGGERAIIPPGSISTALHALPIRALRLDDATAISLDRLGLRRIGDLYPLHRADVTKRFGATLLARLDQALGYAAETLSPLAPLPDHRVSLVFAEPISAPESIARASELLMTRLLRELETQELGIRRLGLIAHRLDDEAPGLIIGTARPSRDAKHLLKLLAEKIETLDPGPGIERMSLSALVAEKMTGVQADFERRHPGIAEADLAPLVDRLTNRLGAGSVTIPRAVASHVPERAVVFTPPMQKKAPGSDWSVDLPPRPIRLLSRPEPIEATAPIPDDPPLSFRWRHMHHRVAKAEGPERIRPEWWQAMDDGKETRDYYRVEIEDGRRFWLFRSGLYAQDTAHPPRWFLHGIFA
ncbi:Y-family DNA polymerase [Dongia rigui]|uniref:DNA polymerase Y family protein n=1 Tax=Dongia rigui TaxID=940149 RepID=A0ABU5DV57_9PROT|nr:DNA polymerase Y family protein [Dongia rigui]MDY0870862.1 DNA polymerase Y family protein [Dongia rigui]